MPTFAIAHRAVAALIAVGVGVEFFACAGAFGATSYNAEMTLGKILLGLAGIAVACSLLPRRFVRHRILGKDGGDQQAWFGALHAANALAVMVTAGTLARRTAGATGERMQAPDIADRGFVSIVRR
jgi:hypothetical protein